MKKFEYEQVREFIADKGYTLISKEYINGDHKLDMLCPFGHPVHMTFHLFKSSGKRCRLCKSSRGENTIRFILRHILPEEVKTEEQKRVMYKGTSYAFDFFLSLGKGLYIEYDGEQHFRPVDFFGGEAGFKKQQLHDQQKTEYVEKKKGHLLRIPYTMTAPEMYKAIQSFLKDHTTINDIALDKLSEAQYYTKYSFTIADVVKFYKENELSDTTAKFSIHEATVRRYFKQVYGMSKKAYKKLKIKEDMAEYYLTHTNKETQKKYNVSDKTLQKYFKEVYGTDKSSFLLSTS
ncbi:hypothetical protein CPT_Mater171 [Bacillus phage Mater]|uniref:Uncharacterized protein n=1 Tax=Bacillus phage Mater TaxID=1540090 RepID=A0A0A0RUS2_9CAUD|nr:HNH endonuclease [Bacillus phage Mater]AIW03328.1 hypothetical protein CPT_Mater171 [Bacillus phage Mater]